jgi:hypothetical protein
LDSKVKVDCWGVSKEPCWVSSAAVIETTFTFYGHSYHGVIISEAG